MWPFLFVNWASKERHFCEVLSVRSLGHLIIRAMNRAERSSPQVCRMEQRNAFKPCSSSWVNVFQLMASYLGVLVAAVGVIAFLTRTRRHH